MALQAQIEFYTSLAKPLALSLNKTDCRARACAWLKFLQDREDSQLKVDYIKLLIFVMQKNDLLGPFSEPPPTDGILQPFPDNSSLSKMILRVTEKASGDAGAGESKPEVKEFVSADLKQYVALQNLPGDQGVQCYMAIGTDEMNKWEQTTSSSCSCNNLTNTSDRMPPAPTDQLQPSATFANAFPPRYSPMIRYQRHRRRMDEMPILPQDTRNVAYESTWIPTKEEVYWLKKMNKMIRRPGGPDTNFMDPVKRYYAQADRSQTTDEDWDPYQDQEDAAEASPSSPDVDQQFAAAQDDFPGGWTGFPTPDLGLYHQPPTPVSPQTAGWNKPAYHSPHVSYQSDIMGRSLPPMQGGFSPGAYDTSQSYYEDSVMIPMAASPPPKPRWAKKATDPDVSGLSENYYSYNTSRSHYQTANSNFQDSDFSQLPSSPSFKYAASSPPRPSPVVSRSPSPVRYRSPATELNEDPSRIVVFHCRCSCKKN